MAAPLAIFNMDPNAADEVQKVAAYLEQAEAIIKVHILLGMGSFSRVFECTVRNHDETVAVKLLTDKDALPGRGREGQFIKGLRHPNLVNVFDIVEGDIEFIVLELCSGGSLQDLLHSDPEGRDTWLRVPLIERLNAGQGVAEALRFLHELDVLHRDVKSGNVFLLSKLIAGEPLSPVKLGDMGFARPIAEFDGMTQGVGTLRYMAPEVIMSGNYGASADVFSMGILMHEIVSGKMPFDKRNEASLILAITQ
ncbi:unnamed protein product, partial [Polarella glacialis]